MKRRTQETKEEITKNWFRLRKAFDDGKIPPPMAQEVSWLLDYIDIMTERFNEARKQIPDEPAAIVIHGPEHEWLSGLDGVDDWREDSTKAHIFKSVVEAREHCMTLEPGWMVLSNPDTQIEKIHYTHEEEK